VDRWRFVLAFPAVLAGCALPPATEGPTAALEDIAPCPDDSTEIRGLIARLGSDDIDERDDASHRLAQRGREAFPIMAGFVNDSDPETVRRLKEIISPVLRREPEAIAAFVRRESADPAMAVVWMVQLHKHLRDAGRYGQAGKGEEARMEYAHGAETFRWIVLYGGIPLWCAEEISAFISERRVEAMMRGGP